MRRVFSNETKIKLRQDGAAVSPATKARPLDTTPRRREDDAAERS